MTSQLNDSLTEEDMLLNNFFETIYTLRESKNLKTIKDLFCSNNERTISVLEFRSSLINLGFDESSPVTQLIIKKYKSLIDKSIISLDNMLIEYEMFLEKKEYLMKNEETKKKFDQRLSDIKSNNPHKKNSNNNNSYNDLDDYENNINLNNFDQINKKTNNYNNNNRNNEDEPPFQSNRRAYMNNSNNIPTQFENNSNRPPTFGKTSIPSSDENNSNKNSTKNKEILEKLENLDNKLLEDLKGNHNFITVKIYENFYNYYEENKMEFDNAIKRYDRNNSGFLDEENFISFFDEILVLSDNEKKIILMDLERNQNGKYSYNNFIEKIENFNPDDITNQIKSFNHSYNDYIVKLRNFFKLNSLDLLEIWKKIFKENPKIEFTNFKNLLNVINYPPLYDEENDYLFNKLSDDGKYILYKKLNSIIKMNPPSNRENLNKKIEENNFQNNRQQANNTNNNNSNQSNNNNQMNNQNKFQIENNNDNYTNMQNNFKNNNNNIKNLDENPDINFKKKDTNNINNNNNNLKAGTEISDNKILSAHHRSSVRQIQNFNEIKNLSKEESKQVIYQRLNEVDSRIRNEVENLEQTKLLILLENIKAYFFRLGNNHTICFQKRDMRQDGFITELDFSMAFGEMKLDLTKEQKDLLFRSIKNKTSTHYNYVEFLQNVYNSNKIEINKILKYCNQSYNDYMVEIRLYFKENNYDAGNIWDTILGMVEVLDSLKFEDFCKNFGFQLTHEEEYRYLFSIMSSEDVTLDKNHFVDLISVDPPEITKFRESFLIKGNEGKINTWKFKIINYTESSAKLHSKNYSHLQNIFKEIHDNSLKRGFTDLVGYFSNLNVNVDGECNELEFINLMAQFGVTKNSSFIMLCGAFKNPKIQQSFNLVKFFNAYFSFYFGEKDAQNNLNLQNKNSDVTSPTGSNNDKKGNNTSSELKINNENNNLVSKGNNQNEINNKNTGNQINEINTNSFINENIKPYRHLSSDDYNYIKNIINFLIEIILTEKKMNVSDFFSAKDLKKNGFISLVEFDKILKDDLEINTEEEKDSLEDLYAYLIDENLTKHIKLDRLIYVFKEMADSGIDLEKKEIPNNNNFNKQNSIGNNNPNNIQQNIPTNQIDSRKEPHNYILREFSNFLSNNRIRFSSLFPNTNENTKEITVYDFKNSFLLAKYPISPDDITILIKYFDSYNKMTINLEIFKNQIKKFQPEYFNKPYQTVSNTEFKKTNTLTKQINDHPKAIEIVTLLNNYIQENKLTLEEFVRKISKSSQISQPEFIQGILDTIGKRFNNLNNLIPDSGKLFDLIDKNKNGILEVKELIFYLSTAQLTIEERKNKVSLSKRMKEDILELFDFFDTDKDQKISKEDFFKALKSLNHNATYNDAEVLLKQMDVDGNKLVDKKEFIDVMEEKIQHQIVLAQEERDYIIKLFKEEDIDRVGYLTIPQLKYLLNVKLNCNLSEDEFGDLVNKADCNYDGLIDVEEFVNLLDLNQENLMNLNNDKFNFNEIENDSNNKNENLSKTLRQINSKRRINPMQFLSIFNGLPMNFIPSFIKEEQKLFKLLPSAMLKPLTDETGILYKDILPDGPINPGKSPKNIGNQNAGGISTNSYKNSVMDLNMSNGARLRAIPTQINTKISFEVATGIPIPDEKMLDRQKNIAGRILKIALYDQIKNEFFGNSIHIEVSWKKEYEDRWYFEDDRKAFNNNIIIRFNDDSDKRNIFVVFEFVLLIIKEGILTETSCGWCSCDIKALYKPAELKLPIRGGCPSNQADISVTDVRTKRSGWAKFTQIFSGQIKTQLPIKIKPFKELANPDKVKKNFRKSFYYFLFRL